VTNDLDNTPLYPIRNFVQLRPNIATAGQPKENPFATIADEGYSAVINLAMPDSKDSIQNEGAIVDDHGMSYIHIPVPFDCPRPVQIKDFCAYLIALNDRQTFVHCIMSYRVSAIMYHYLEKVVGDDAASCRSPMFNKWQPDPTWQNVLSWSKEEIGL
jgi:protein tyrosine phosphatase (PTP) superfamily phosphohydrolase (DUF442 family)